MKFKVICNSCQRGFLAESQQYGRVRFRCPYCGKVVTCQLDAPSNAPQSKPVGRSRRLAQAVASTAQATGSRISRFRRQHANGDLWLFFGFSFLFIVLVIVCLFLFAEAAKLIQSGQSWLFKTWLEIIHSL